MADNKTVAALFNTGNVSATANRARVNAYNDKANAAAAASSKTYGASNTNTNFNDLINMLYRYVASGNFSNQTELFFTRHNRFGTNLVSPNMENCGLTFFTRPKLPLTSGNLVYCPTLAALDTTNPNSFAYAIRLWLDTKLQQEASYTGSASECKFFDMHTPFNIPLSNACVSQGGWPDPFIQTFTTTGGFYGEDQTFPIGSDRLRRTYDLSFTFSEIQGGPILAMLYAWYEVMSCLTEGSMVAYAEDIDARRMCYTCSIYRFLFDPSKTHITHYAKATGCFPKAPPLGALFNQSKGEYVVSAAQEIPVTFVANHVEYDDPRILLDFNLLATRYCHDIATYPILKPASYNNFKGYPFVISTYKGIELAFRERTLQAVEDEQNGKMMATTRERFEQREDFAKLAKESKDNVSEADTGKFIPMGDEARYVYRVASKGSDGDIGIRFVLDSRDGYSSSHNFTKYNDPKEYDAPEPSIKQNSVIGASVSTVVRQVLSTDAIAALKATKLGKGDNVGPYDPIHMSGSKSGTIDEYSKSRADATEDRSDDASNPIIIERGNRDIPDAGSSVGGGTLPTE